MNIVEKSYTDQCVEILGKIARRMDSPIIINWVSPVSFLGMLGVIFNFYLIFR